jgi:ERCC4-type nuclease
MNIIVDTREHALIEKLNELPHTNQNITIATEQLLIGDILLRNASDAKEIVLFERKTFADLLASIKDGRYKEQSHRLTHTSGLNPHHIIYIVEGIYSTLRSPADKKIIMSAMASLSYFKGFSVFRTATVLETAEIILSMASKIQKESENGTPDPSSCGAGVSYSSFVKKEKRDNITPENIGEILLCQIPGISSHIASEILQHFDGSFSKLVEEIKTAPEKLDVIYLESAGGKKRKLSSSVISALKLFLSK